ncbi:ABC transporter ATP-binding protein [Prosthecobacter sp.]|uniref:ABC transporter ATP-binding protein n=1 Tax=Prosthecobacter sp. TaxID=1965333 RepID=UPI00378420A3
MSTVFQASPSNQTAVRCRGLTKTFGSGAAAVQALRGVDLEVRTGELLMLVGPSGCGKTTLISVIAGVLSRDGGDCAVFGRDYLTMTEQETTRFRGEHIGFVFQAFNLIPTLTAAENVSAPLVIKGMKRRPAVAQAREVLRQVGFDERMQESSPVDLSGGQQQRVAIARALVHQPDLIVCDEPTSALDSETGWKVMELMRNLALATNRALVVVTHDARIFEFADRIARMEDGRITGIETPLKPAAGAAEPRTL